MNQPAEKQKTNRCCVVFSSEEEIVFWPRISVVVPSYNQGFYLEKTLQSIVEQNYPNLELIVMDGGSTDNSVEIIKKFESHISYWVSQSDEGQTDALIKGFDKSTGEILCWLNSDDLYEENALKTIGRYFNEHPAVDAVFGGTLYIDAEGALICIRKEFAFNSFILVHGGNYVPSPSTFWRREIYQKVGGLNPELSFAMDADLWLRFAEHHAKFVHLPLILSQMRFHDDCKTSLYREKTKQEFRSITNRYCAHVPKPLLILSRIYAKFFRFISLVLGNLQSGKILRLCSFILKDIGRQNPFK